MDSPRRLFALPALSALALALGCAGPPIPAPIEGLPVCPDFMSGNTKMEGSLRYPVRLKVLDGSNVLFRIVLSGLRRPDDPIPRSFVADDNARYTLEWAQCANPRAPRTATEAAQSNKAKEKAHDGESTAYDCGDAVVYKADGVLATKKGDKASHVITFVPPPNPACWTGDTGRDGEPGRGSPNPSGPTAAADAGPAAADAGPAAADAGATDAGAAASDAGAGGLKK